VIRLCNDIINAQRSLSLEKSVLEDLFSSVLSQFKKYHSSENLKLNNVGIFPKLKIAYFNGKISFNSSLAKFHSIYFGMLWVKYHYTKFISWDAGYKRSA